MQNYNSDYNNQGNYAREETSGMAIASLVLGIIAIVFSFCFYSVSIICSILSIIFCAARNKEKKGKGMAIAGLVCGILALIPAIFIAATGAALLGSI